MASFTMLFTGLILHHSKGDNAKTAVLVDDPHHRSHLLILAAANPTDDKWDKSHDGDYIKYELKKCIVTIKDIETSAITIDSSFNQHVPSLKSILEAPDDLWDEVKEKKVTPSSTTAFVDYSGGALSVIGCFEDEVEFVPPVPGAPRCIGVAVRFEGRTTAGSKIRIDNGIGGYIVVPDQTVILIQNVSSHDGRHQKEYKRLMKKKTEPRPMDKTGGTCQDCSPTEGKSVGQIKEPLLSVFRDVKASLSIECSNSQWP